MGNTDGRNVFSDSLRSEMENMNKVLMVATVASTIAQFNMNNISILNHMGCQVDVAADFKDQLVWPEQKSHEFRREIKKRGGKNFQIDFSRNPSDIKLHIKALKQITALLRKENYEFIHTHIPVASVLTRIAGHYTDTKIIYTAHGFHFYHGAPWRNWLIFYPVEKMLSRWTDLMITINREDYRRARRNFHARKTVYIPGAGVDIKKIQNSLVCVKEKRKELGAAPADIMILSVGELSRRKNHEIVIKALSQIQNPDIQYFIVGEGELEKDLKELISDLGLERQVHLAGFRTDVAELCKVSDIFVFPSRQEGLPVALMEAVASETPVVCSHIRGNTDLITDRRFLFHEKKVDDVIRCLEPLLTDRKQLKFMTARSVKNNLETLKRYDISVVEKRMKQQYGWIFGDN